MKSLRNVVAPSQLFKCARKVIDTQSDSTERVCSDETDATWMKKGDQCVYGYSAKVTTDEESLVESVTPFSANSSEMTRLGEVLDRLDSTQGPVFG